MGRIKGQKLIGKQVEVVPWWQRFSPATSLKGQLVNIRGTRASVKGRPPKKPQDYAYVIRPSAESKRRLVSTGLMNPTQKTVIRIVAGHKIRSTRRRG